jgi:hypothetical protein
MKFSQMENSKKLCRDFIISEKFQILQMHFKNGCSVKIKQTEKVYIFKTELTYCYCVGRPCVTDEWLVESKPITHGLPKTSEHNRSDLSMF